MRFPGENTAGQAPRRRQSPSGQDAPPRSRRRAGGNQPGGESSLFVPGYRDGRQPAAEPAGDAQRPGSGYGWAGGAASKGPVRGFPPAPGQPPPLYPPGQFSAWNRTSGTEGDGQADGHGAFSWAEGDGHADGHEAALAPRAAGYPAPGHAGAGHLAGASAADAAAAAWATGAADGGYADAGFEPGYSDLAVRDPAADVTSTQTWGAVSDGVQTGPWTGETASDDGRQASTWTNRRGPGDGGLAAGAPAGPPADRRAPAAMQAPGGAGGPVGPQGYPAQPAGTSAPGTQPGRSRGHGSGVHSSRTGPRPRRKPSRGLLAAGLALLVALGGGTYILFRSGHGSATAARTTKQTHRHTSPSAAVSTPAPSPTPTLGPWGHIESRAADPVPLTLAEVFPATFTADASYGRTVRRESTNCSAAVVGAQLQHAVRHPGCSQVLRASYLSASKKLMGTIGVLNLSTFNAAEQAGRAAGPSEFIAQLAAAKGPTRNLTKGTGIEQADVKGHYLILVWAEFTNLQKPKTKKQRQELEAFLSLLIQKTANVSLTNRMVNGQP